MEKESAINKQGCWLCFHHISTAFAFSYPYSKHTVQNICQFFITFLCCTAQSYEQEEIDSRVLLLESMYEESIESFFHPELWVNCASFIPVYLHFDNIASTLQLIYA